MVLAVLTIALGIFISEIQTTVGWVPLIAALAVCLGIFWLCFNILVRQICPVSTGLLEDLSKRIDRFVERGAVTWLFTNEHLVQFERSIEVDEIWLVTSDLAADIPGSPFYEVVGQNLKRGVKYTYFIPRSLATEARGRQLLERHRGHGNIKVIHLSDDFFFLGPRLDFAIYDPMNRYNKRCGYMQLPVDSKDCMHAKLDVDLVDAIIGKLLTFTGRTLQDRESPSHGIVKK